MGFSLFVSRVYISLSEGCWLSLSPGFSHSLSVGFVFLSLSVGFFFSFSLNFDLSFTLSVVFFSLSPEKKQPIEREREKNNLLKEREREKQPIEREGEKKQPTEIERE